MITWGKAGAGCGEEIRAVAKDEQRDVGADDEIGFFGVRAESFERNLQSQAGPVRRREDQADLGAFWS